MQVAVVLDTRFVRIEGEVAVTTRAPGNDWFLGNAILAASLAAIAVDGRHRILNARRKRDEEDAVDAAFADWSGDDDQVSLGFKLSVQAGRELTALGRQAQTSGKYSVSSRSSMAFAAPAVKLLSRGFRSFVAATWLVAFLSLAGWFGYRALPDQATATASAATPVATAKAKPRYITKNIEAVRAGETVLAMDPATGRLREKPVLQTFVRTADHLQLVTFTDSAGRSQTLQTTDEHPFWSVDRREWIVAEDLILKERVLGPSGEIQRVTDNRREEHPDGITVYNFEVDDFHSYFVESDSDSVPLLVHNAGKKYKAAGPDGKDFFGKGLTVTPPVIPKIIHMHHSIPKEIQKKLPAKLQEDPDIIGRPGLPNRRPVEAGKHLNDVHNKTGISRKKTGIAGGRYNLRFQEEILKISSYKKVTKQEILDIRDALMKEFGL